MIPDSLQQILKAASAALLLLGFGCTSFRVTSSPQADIYENGERIGRTPYSFSLMSGERTFTLKQFGYVEEDFTVTSLDRKVIHFDLRWVGKTRVNTQPPGAQVVRIDDGEVLGKTPCALYLSRPGRVELRLKGFETVERDLDPNETYLVPLESSAGFKTAFYKDIIFESGQGPVEIYDRVAGERIGVAPARLNIEAGAALEYRLPGYKSEYALISRNAPHRIDIELEPLVRVTLAGPEGASVYRAGGVEKLGQLPYVAAVEGTAVYEIKKEGFYDFSIAVAPDSPRLLQIDLKQIPYKVIETEPPGGEVFRLGGLEKLGTAPFEVVVESERVFEIKKEGYRPEVVGIGPSSPRTLSVRLSPMPRDDPDAAAIGSFDNHVVEPF